MPRITAGQYLYGDRPLNRRTRRELEQIAKRHIVQAGDFKGRLRLAITAHERAATLGRSLDAANATLRSKEDSLRAALRDKDAAMVLVRRANVDVENAAEEMELIRGQRKVLHEQVFRLETDFKKAETNLLAALDENGRMVWHAIAACAACLVGGAGLGAWLLPGIIKAVWGG